MYYYTTYNKLFAFSVDDRTNTEINVGREVGVIASLTGIDCGVKAVFKSNDDNCTYTLNMDDTVTQVAGEQDYVHRALFPSTSNPKRVRDAVFVFYDCLMKNGKRMNKDNSIKFHHYSTVRVYRNVFLTYDNNTKSWVLVRVFAP